MTDFVDLRSLDLSGSAGAVWSLPHGGDLDANLVVLPAGESMPSHVNDEVDVLVVGLEGSGAVTVDGEVHQLGHGRIVLVPKGAQRSTAADVGAALVYLTVHRSRQGPTIRSATR